VSGLPLPFTPSGRFGHLRAEHPAYWRTVLLRLGAPWVFLAIVFAFRIAAVVLTVIR